MLFSADERAALQKAAMGLFFHGIRTTSGQERTQRLAWLSRKLEPLTLDPQRLRIGWAGSLVKCAQMAWNCAQLSGSEKQQAQDRGHVLDMLALGVDTLPGSGLREATLALFCQAIEAQDWRALTTEQLDRDIHTRQPLQQAAAAFLARRAVGDTDLPDWHHRVIEDLMQALMARGGEACAADWGLSLPLHDLLEPPALAGWVHDALERPLLAFQITAAVQAGHWQATDAQGGLRLLPS